MQFELLVKGLARGTSFSKLSSNLSDVTDVTGFHGFGRPTERDVGLCVRQLVGINLTRIADLLDSCWGFSIAVDGATHMHEGYLDVRLCIPVYGDVVNFHALAIPLGETAHTGANFATAVSDLLELLCPGSVSKILGITTDGAANMVGKFKGFSKQLADTVSTGNVDAVPYIV